MLTQFRSWQQSLHFSCPLLFEAVFFWETNGETHLHLFFFQTAPFNHPPKKRHLPTKHPSAWNIPGRQSAANPIHGCFFLSRPETHGVFFYPGPETMGSGRWGFFEVDVFSWGNFPKALHPIPTFECVFLRWGWFIRDRWIFFSQGLRTWKGLRVSGRT